MTQKRILIINPSMAIGGVEKALISLLHSIPSDKYDVSLMLVNPQGNFMSFIPEYVHQLSLPFKPQYHTQGLSKLLKQKWHAHYYGQFFVLLLALGFQRIFHWSKPLAHLLFLSTNLQFDYVFNFGGTSTIPCLLVENCCNAYKKFIWMHNEFKLAGNNPRKYLWHFKSYDKIFCVSDNIRNELIAVLPRLKDKAVTLYNIIDTETILTSAEKPGGFTDTFTGTRILSVGRLHPQKGFDIALQACRILLEKGYNIRWYILGEGEQRHSLELLIKENQLKDKFVLLGSVLNPYPYFKQCDIYVQSSRFEGYCLTLAEAKIFNKPIVTTDFAGTKEQIQDEVTGLIALTTPIDIAAAIEELLLSKSLQQTLANNLQQHTRQANSFQLLESYLK